MADVSKFSTYVVLKVITTVSKFSTYIVVNRTRIQKTFDFSYAVEGDSLFNVWDFNYRIQFGKTFTFNYKIMLSKSFDFDYAINWFVNKSFNFDYRIQLGKEFDFDYTIGGTVARVWSFDYKVLNGVIKTFDFDYGIKTLSKSFYFTYMVNPIRPVHKEWIFDYEVGVNNSAIGGKDVLLLPEVPITERWEWTTAISRSEDGSEQRQSLRQHPRINSVFRYLMLDDRDRRTRIEEIMSNIRSMMKVPQYQYGVYTTVDRSVGANTIPCDMATTDIRVGDLVYYFTADDFNGGLTRATAVSSGSVTVSPVLEFDLPKNSWVTPAINMSINDGSGLAMRSIAGASELALTAEKVRPVLRPGAPSGLVPSFKGYPLLQLRPSADADVTDLFAANVRTMDDAVDVAPVRFPTWKMPAMSGNRMFRTKRLFEFDFWREFAAKIVGSRVPFFLPTYRADIIPVDPNASGATFVARGTMPYITFSAPAYKQVMIEKTSGTTIHTITSVSLSGDNTIITLDSGDVEDAIKIGYVNLVRIDNDVIQLEHHQEYTIITMTVRTVYE